MAQVSQHGSKHGGRRPEPCAGFGDSSVWGRKPSCGFTYIDPGQPLVSEGGNEVAEDGNGEENEKLLIGCAREHGNGFAFGIEALVEDVDAANEEEGSTKVDGEGDGNVSDNVEPAANPTGDATPVGRR